MARRCFVNYSRRDVKVLDRLMTHCSILEREGWIEFWTDQALVAGAPWRKEIADNLERMDIFLPLVSPDFLKSQFAYEHELGEARRREALGAVVITPLLIRSCDWEHSLLGPIQALDRGNVLPVRAPKRDEALTRVVKEFRKRARVLYENRPGGDDVGGNGGPMGW